MSPPSVVGSVTVVLDAVGGELALFASRFDAHPQIVVANECRKLLVGGDVEGSPAAAHSWSSRAGRALIRLRGLLSIHLCVAAGLSRAQSGGRLCVGLLLRMLNRLRRLERATLRVCSAMERLRAHGHRKTLRLGCVILDAQVSGIDLTPTGLAERRGELRSVKG